MRVLSIQSAVSFGHVGNSAAVFPLQRLGHEVMPVYTVTFSNHTGYGQWRGRVAPADEVGEIIHGIDERGQLGRVDRVLSGYLGDPDVAGVVVDAVRRVKALNPSALYALDPVMGNAATGCFVDPSIPEILRNSAVPIADVISPNQFELGYLTGTEPRTLDEIRHSVALLQAMGPRVVLVTSVKRQDRPARSLEVLAADGDRSWLVRTPELPELFNGTGDTIMALFVGHLANGFAVPEALERSVSGIFAILSATVTAGERELRLVQAQDGFAHPACEFPAVPVQ